MLSISAFRAESLSDSPGLPNHLRFLCDASEKPDFNCLICGRSVAKSVAIHPIAHKLNRDIIIMECDSEATRPIRKDKELIFQTLK